MKRHCLLQDIFSKKTLSVPTLAVDTVLVVRHFLFLSKKTLSVTKFSVFRHFLLRYCWLWDIFCFYQKRHCPLRNFLFSDTFCWDIVGCETFSVFIKKDIVRYEIFCFQTFAVVRHVQSSDTCSCPKRAVVRNVPLSETCSCPTLYIMRHFLWPRDGGRFENLSGQVVWYTATAQQHLLFCQNLRGCIPLCTPLGSTIPVITYYLVPFPNLTPFNGCSGKWLWSECNYDGGDCYTR